MKKEEVVRMSTSNPIHLKHWTGSTLVLNQVKTGKNYKSEMIKELKISLWNWMENQNFQNIKDAEIDLAIVVHLNKQRMKRQDCDNIAKVVLDGLTQKTGDPFLINDDSQIRRLLVYKLPRKEYEQFETDQLHISFAKHDPSKQMELEDCEII